MRTTVAALCFFLSIVAAFGVDAATKDTGQALTPGSETIRQPIDPKSPLSLQECVDMALQNNRTRATSKFAVEIAEAQYEQARSAYWPQFLIKATYTLMDESPNFLFPASSISIPLLPAPIPVPEQNVKLMDRETLMSSLQMTYPLYTGGLRRAIVTQASKGVQAAKEEARRTDLQVIYDVKRFYYGTVLARELLQTAKDALARMEVTLELTENLYKKGSGRVKKTDYLRNKTVVEAIRSAVASFEGNVQIAKAALINTMGLDWDVSVEISEAGLPYSPLTTDLKPLVGNAYSFNPDWAKLQAGLDAAEAKIKEAKSGHHPKVGLFGNLTHIDNEYRGGIVTSRNKDSWTVGVGMELPLFAGFRTTYEVKEAHARLGKLKEQKILLREGIALQVKHIFLQMKSAQEQKTASESAAKASEENRDLNERAYQEELVETKDVIEAQLMESLMKGQYYKALFDHVESQIHLDFLIGKEVMKLVKGEQN